MNTRLSVYSAIITIPKSFVSALLISIFFLAYIITDYWNIPSSPLSKLLIRDGTLCLGIIWGLLSSHSIRFEYKRKYLWIFILLLLFILLINARTLTSVIPWMGDEDHHIRMVLGLLRKAPPVPMLLFFIAWLLVLYLSWSKPRWAVFSGILLFLLLISSYPVTSQFGGLRYPFVNYWPYALIINLFSPLMNPYHEFLYRIIPFISVVTLTFVFWHSLQKKTGNLNLLWGAAVALIPTVYYYSSIFYLEMPAILLMTIVCLRIDRLLSEDFMHFKQDIGWYALILVGFIKETTLPFILCFLIFRTVFVIYKRLQKNQPEPQEDDSIETPVKLLKSIIEEFAVWFILLVPILYYLIFRAPFVHRGYQLTFSNLFDPVIYPVIFRALFEQFGGWIILFLVGSIMVLKNKKYPVFLFNIFLFLGYILFFVVDQIKFIGYSRFFLFLLPPLLAVSKNFINYLITKKKLMAYTLLAILVSSSLILTPIQKDGTKKPYWGNYLVNTSEHYYPVNDAINWMKEKSSSKSVLFSGLGYIYFKEFYFYKYNWRPTQTELFIADVRNTDQVNFEIALSKAENDGYENVLHFVQGSEIPRVPLKAPYHQEKIFENLSHKIVLFTKNK